VSLVTGAALIVVCVLMITGVLARLSTLATPFGV